MSLYKPHLACFSCRKTFRRRLLCDVSGEKESKEATCPECGLPLADMGLDFKSPPKDDIKAWTHMASLYTVGVTFHSCGCSGPGYIPKDKETLREHLEETKKKYIIQLREWINYLEPESKKERDLRRQKGDILYPPFQLTKMGKRKNIPKEEIIDYWTNKIESIEENINKIKI